MSHGYLLWSTTYLMWDGVWPTIFVATILALPIAIVALAVKKLVSK